MQLSGSPKKKTASASERLSSCRLYRCQAVIPAEAGSRCKVPTCRVAQCRRKLVEVCPVNGVDAVPYYRWLQVALVLHSSCYPGYRAHGFRVGVTPFTSFAVKIAKSSAPSFDPPTNFEAVKLRLTVLQSAYGNALLRPSLRCPILAADLH